MRLLLIACTVLLITAPHAAAQDRDSVQRVFGPARREERLLADGATLNVHYSPSGRLSLFVLAGKEAQVTSYNGKRVVTPPSFLDGDFAWDVIRQLSTHDSRSAVKVTVPRLCITGDAPGYNDSYELGELFLVFSYDPNGNLLSVYGISWSSIREPSN